VAPVIPILMIASAVVSAVGAIQQGQAAKKAASFNEQVALQNAGIARRDAAAEAAQASRENYMRLGAARAAAGAGGGREGSALDVLGDIASQGELERQTILYRGENVARGYGNTAALERMQGKAAVRGSYMKAGGELLSGVAGAGGTEAGSAFLKRF